MKILPVTSRITFTEKVKEASTKEKKIEPEKDEIQKRLEKELEQKSKEAQILLNKPQKYEEKEVKKNG